MPDSKPHSTFLLGDRSYDFLKKLVQIIIPAFGTFYFAMSAIWGWPHADKVTGSSLAVAAFLGAWLGISTAQYNASGKAFDGVMTVARTDGPGSPVAVAGVHYNGDTQELQQKSSIKMKVEEVVPVIEPEMEHEDEEPPQNPASSSRRKR